MTKKTMEELRGTWLKSLDDIKKDITVLRKNISVMQKKMNEAVTMEELEDIINHFDIENGIEHISVY